MTAGFIVLSIIFLSHSMHTYASTTSYVANGVWEEDSSLSNLESYRYMKTPSKKVWKPSGAAKHFDNVTACDALLNKGITKISFHGDSYMRQIYAAFLITLNGDYRYGSLADPKTAPHCEYNRQFEEKNCGTRQLNHYGKVCGEQIILDPVLTGVNDDHGCSNQPGTVIMWSFGNHKLSRHGRAGVNNATAFQEFFEKDICPLMREKSATYSGEAGGGSACSIWWVSTHYRVKAHFDDEKPEVVKAFNEGMKQFYDSGNCGNVNYIDVYNTTAQLALNHPEDAEQMTYDGVHWGYEVNLVKAQVLINALLASH